MRIFSALVVFFMGLSTLSVAQVGVGPWVESQGITDAEGAVIQQRLVSSHSAVTPGQNLTLAWEFSMQPGWHIYWQNAGDSGLPPELRDSLGQAVSLTFPVPEVIAMPPVVNYGYKEAVTFTAPYAVPSNLPQGVTELSFKADFLYCKDVCLPGQAALTLPLQVAAQAEVNPAFKPVQVLPQPLLAPVVAYGNGLTAQLQLPAALAQAGVRFVPHEDGVLDDNAPQPLQGDILTLTLDNQLTTPPTTLRGLLLLNGQGYELEVPLKPGTLTSAQGGLGTALLFALGGAFVAGLILNLMPCVLPVLSLKILALVKQHNPQSPSKLMHMLAYTGGVVASFWALALLIVGLQSSGQALGWGFHLQQPLVVAALSLLMVAMALNFFGVFEPGRSLTRLAGVGKANSLSGSALTGMLAVVVATPCTVPFMGGALAYALTQPVFNNLAVFTALGLGMAAPFLLLGLMPKALAWLPKPGAWMLTFKHLLGWPMLATALWLTYVFNSLTGQVATFALLGVALLLAMGLWFYGLKPGLLRALPLVLILGFGGLALQRLNQPAPEVWQPWSAQAVAAGQAQNRPVFVDFTADWCLTCKVTEATVLNTNATQQLFADKNVLLLKADWTRQDATITAELARHGRKGVPLYLLYLPGQDEPIVLPQLITTGVLAEALKPKP